MSGRGRGGVGAAVSTPRQQTAEERSAGCVRSPALSLRTPLRVPYLLLSLLLLLGVVPGPGSLGATRSRYQEARRRPPGLTRKRGVQARLGTGRSRGACVATESHALAPPFLPLGVSQSQRCLAEPLVVHTHLPLSLTLHHHHPPPCDTCPGAGRRTLLSSRVPGPFFAGHLRAISSQGQIAIPISLLRTCIFPPLHSGYPPPLAGI